MRILYVGAAQSHDRIYHYYKIPEKLVNGFIRLGHMTYVFNDRVVARASNIFRNRKLGRQAINRELLTSVEIFKPDAVLFGNTDAVRDETYAEIRRLSPGVKLLYRNVDSPMQRGNAEKIHSKLGLVDGIFLTTGDPSVLAWGTRQTFVDFMPNPIDPSIEDQRAFARPQHDYDLFFAGGPLMDMADQRREILLRVRAKLGDLRFGLFGGVLDTKGVFGRAFIETIGASRIGLSLDREDQHWLYASDRMAQYIGNGALTAVRAGKGFERYFAPDDLIFYRDAEHLVSEIRSALADDAAWRARAEAAWRKAHEIFDVTRVADYILARTFAADQPPANPWLKD